MAPRWQDLRADLGALHAAALGAADPGRAVARHLRLAGATLEIGPHALRLEPGSRIFLVAFGKASPGMTRAALEALGDRVAAGVVAHPHRGDVSGAWPDTLSLVGAGHPMPDAGSLRAGERTVELLSATKPGDVVVVLVSGGGSALLESLRRGISLEDLAGVTRALQRSGADILELNTVRRALSRLKGGGLTRLARPARVAALLLSDVLGDPPHAIASGPTVPSPTGPAQALEVLERRALAADFPAVAEALRAAASEQPPADAEAAAEQAATVIVGSNQMAAEALRDEAERRGFRSLILTTHLQGEAREAGRVVGGAARTVHEAGLPVPAPACLVFGGETTVTVRGQGRGGRNQELALGAAGVLEGCPRAAVLSFATDGVDGPTEAAGALATGETLPRARALGLSPHRAFEDNDTEPFFRALDDLWVSGPTGTNVNDLAVALVYP